MLDLPSTGLLRKDGTLVQVGGMAGIILGQGVTMLSSISICQRTGMLAEVIHL
jgi:hypothetical protein